MRGRASLTVALALAITAPAVGAGAAAPSAQAASCPKKGVVTVIAGKRTCLASGRACKATSARQKQYRRNGFTCVKGKLKKVKQEF